RSCSWGGSSTRRRPRPDAPEVPMPDQPIPPGDAVVARGPTMRSAAARGAPPADAAVAAAAVNDLGTALLRRLAAAEPDANLAISPVSIELALAMVRLGAVNETRAELDALLGAPGGDELDRALHALDSALAARAGVAYGAGREGEI